MLLLLPLLLPLLLSPLPSLAATEPTLYTSTLYHHPASSTPTPLATIAYHPQHPHLSSLLSFTSPSPPHIDPKDLTRIAIHLPDSGYRSTLTNAQSLAKGEGRFKIVVTQEGELLGASWRAMRGEANGKGNGKGEFEMVVQQQGVRAVIEKAAVGGKGKKAGEQKGEGEEGEVEEKTFLQKYWWLLLAAAFLAFSGGGGDAKK